MEEEDTDSYYEAFWLAFQTAEADVSHHLPWAHILEACPQQLSRSSTLGIKAVLLDKHGGQFKGLEKYFETKYALYGNGEWHTSRLIKICTVHFERSIKKLAKKGLSQGILSPLHLYSLDL